jgi:hypothetical protein
MLLYIHMINIVNNKSRFIFSSILVFAIVFLGTIFLFNNLTPKVESVSSHNVSGYAWSDNIGWISFNSGDGLIDYGVNIDMSTVYTTGVSNFSGYAWSDNIGWISFNRTQTGNPPGAPFNTDKASDPVAQIKWIKDANGNVVSGKIVGWARALNGINSGSSYDGWIKFSKDSSDSGADYSTLIIKEWKASKISGYAWGSDVIGWISFSGANPNYQVNGSEILGLVIDSAIGCKTNPNLEKCKNPPTGQEITPTPGPIPGSGGIPLPGGAPGGTQGGGSSGSGTTGSGGGGVNNTPKPLPKIKFREE